MLRFVSLVLTLFGFVAAASAEPLKLAAFKADITPPIGSPLCLALVPPVAGVDDPLQRPRRRDHRRRRADRAVRARLGWRRQQRLRRISPGTGQSRGHDARSGRRSRAASARRAGGRFRCRRHPGRRRLGRPIVRRRLRPQSDRCGRQCRARSGRQDRTGHAIWRSAVRGSIGSLPAAACWGPTAR